MSENNGARFYSYQCPNCGADMELSTDHKSIVCEYCGKKLYFANTNNANNPNAQPQLLMQQEQNRLQQTLRSAAKARKIVLVVYITIFAFVFGCVAVSVIAGVGNVSKSRRTVTATTLKEVNPFDGIRVEISGVAPYAKVQSVRGTAVRNAQFKADKTEGLSNGDVITITVDDMYGYSWTETSYAYTVLGLDTYVTLPSQIPQSELETIQGFGADKIKKSWASSIGLDESEYQLTITPCAMYVSVRKQASFSFDNNRILVEYQIDFEFGEQKGTLYDYVSIPDAVLASDGSFRLAYDEAEDKGDFVWLKEYGITANYGNIWTCGFGSILEMESDMQENDYTLVKE